MILNEHFKGSISTIILHLLSENTEMYGYEICQKVGKKTNNLIQFTEGAIYPSLHRLEKKGLIKSRKEKADGRVRKYYSITNAGSTESKKLIHSFRSLIEAMNTLIGKNLSDGITGT